MSRDAEGISVGRDRIELSGIVGHGFHGVLSREKLHGQQFLVDVVLCLDLSEAAASDDLNQTVNYDAVSRAVEARITGEAFDLIETLAQRIADDCLTYSRVDGVEVAVHKPAAPVANRLSDVVVRIMRSRSDL